MKVARFMITVLILVGGAVGVTGPAIASPLERAAPTPDDVRSGYSPMQLLELGGTGVIGASTAAAASNAGSVTCRIIRADSPHISRGAGGVIFKTRVSCSGSCGCAPTVTVRVLGALYYDPAAFDGDTAAVRWYKVRSSSEPRTVPTNGTVSTFYTPRIGVDGASGRGHFQGTATLQQGGVFADSDTSFVSYLRTY